MRLITKLWATLLLLCVAGVANAAKTYEVDQKFTSVADLDGKAFAIVHEADSMAVYGSGAQNLGYGKITAAVTGTGNSGYYFKLEASSVEGAYLLRLQTPAGEPYSVWGSPGYLNSGADGGFDGCFILGLSNQNGQDVENGAVWEIEYVADKGFAFKNKARGGYFAGPSPAPTGTEPIYWTLCTLKEGEEAPDPEPEVIPEPEAPLAEDELIPDFFSITNEGGIPYGYEVKFGNEDRLYPTTYTGGARMFAFAEGGDFTRGIYFREGYIQYGNVKALALEGGKKYIVYFNSAMWKDSGTTMEFTITKEGDETALLDSVINNTPNVNGSKDAVTGSTRSEIEFTPESDGNYILKWDATGWRECLLANVGVKVAPAAVAEDTLPIDIQFGANYNEKGVQNYTSTWTAKKDGKTWTIVNFNNNNNGWNFIKCGSKNNESVASITSPAINAEVKAYTISLTAAANVNSAKLTMMNGEEKVGEDIDITESFVAGEVVVPVEGQKGYSYVLTINNAQGSGNGSVQISKITLSGEVKEPVHIANTAETAYTVAKAIELIDAGEALSDTVFVKGIVSQVDSYSDEYKNITYWISEDGKTEGAQFECFRGKGIDGADFASINDVEVGAEVVVKGILQKYGETYELSQGNALVSYKAPFKPLFADGKYYIYNVGTKKYLAAGSSWGTHAVVNAAGLDYDIKVADGKYTLDSQVSNGGENHFLSGEWNDGAAFGWSLEKVSDGIFTISNGSQFLTAKENDEVTLANDATVETAQWQVKTLDERLAELAAATVEAPIDATFLIQDADFGRNDLRMSAWKMEASNQNLSGGEDGNGTVGNNNAESYHSTFTLSQTLSKAPAGKYKMTAQGYYRQDDNATEDIPVFYANDKTAEFPAKSGNENSMTDAAKSFSAGQYTIEPIEFTVFEDGLLTIGAKGTATHQWVIFDNFRLTYLSSEIPADEFKPAYENALAAAQAALADEAYAAVTGEEKTALQQAIDDNKEIAEPTSDLYKAAISALNTATSNFTGAKGAYEALATAKTVNATYTFVYASAAKKAAAEATLTLEPTSAADATAKTDSIAKAYRQYAESHALLEGVEGAINMTDSIKNPNAEEAIATPWVVVKGEGSGGGLDVKNGEPWTDGADNATHKYFDGGNWGAQAWDVALEQKITLPKGNYLLTAVGRASADVDLRLFAGEDTVQIASIGASGGLFNRGWNDASVEFTMTKADSIVIGVRGVTTKQYNWMSFSNFRLVKFAPTAEEIALENAINALKAIIAGDKTIATEGQKGADALTTAITTAETAANAADATVESIAAARAALAKAVATFVKANTDNMTEIPQNQGKDLDTFTRTELVEGEDYNTYTAAGDLNIAIKMVDLDVKDCDYVVVKFAEPVAAGWKLAFWSNQDLTDVPAGATEFKYVFADDPKCAINNDVLPQICMMTFFGGFQAPLEAKIVAIYKHQVPHDQIIPTEVAEPTYTYPASWDFTNWSEATVANLKADAAWSIFNGWSDVEKDPAKSGNPQEPTEASKDNCFWHQGKTDAYGQLYANGKLIEETKGLKFTEAYAATRGLAIAVNYASTSLGEYAGAQYLWLGGGGKKVPCFVLPNVPAGVEITAVVESHKPSDARGIELYAGSIADENKIGDSFKPTTKDTHTWTIENAGDIVVYNTSGCHIYSLAVTAKTDGISVLNANKQNGAIFNLNGQKMNKAQKGLYIINGKRVVVK